jgi:hypothetical protein
MEGNEGSFRSGDQSWVSRGLPPMNCLISPMHIKVVDQLQVDGAGVLGQVSLKEKAVSWVVVLLWL